MAVPAEVEAEVLALFSSGEQLGAREVMSRTKRGRVVYRTLQKLVKAGLLVVVRREATARKPRAIFGLPDSAPF